MSRITENDDVINKLIFYNKNNIFEIGGSICEQYSRKRNQ